MKLYRWTKCSQKAQMRMLKSILNHFKVNVFDQVITFFTKLVQIKYVGKKMKYVWNVWIGYLRIELVPRTTLQQQKFKKLLKRLSFMAKSMAYEKCLLYCWHGLTLISSCIFAVGILKHLTDVLELRDFLQILPDEGNMLFFLPYITECQEKEKSKQLLNIIRKKGEHLQHYIWYLLICVIKVRILDKRKKHGQKNYGICITMLLFYFF